ncbi:hypothetical protein [Streptomyces hirsutus]|uniref:hypothetical protein n=1 Tax=Streptomyces hirsutus TaxID=35620 RepID=UPI00367A1F59
MGLPTSTMKPFHKARPARPAAGAVRRCAHQQLAAPPGWNTEVDEVEVKDAGELQDREHQEGPG